MPLKKPPAKVAHNRSPIFFSLQYCTPTQNQPKSHFLFHKKSPCACGILRHWRNAATDSKRYLLITQRSLPLQMAWGRVNEVEQSCFRSGVYIPEQRSHTLKYAPAREFAEGCHDHGELCKYGHVRQAYHRQEPLKQTN